MNHDLNDDPAGPEQPRRLVEYPISTREDDPGFGSLLDMPGVKEGTMKIDGLRHRQVIVTVTSDGEPVGHMAFTRDQARQLRDALDQQLGEETT